MILTRLYLALRQYVSSPARLRARHSRKQPARTRQLQCEPLEFRLALSTLPPGFQETLVAGGLYEPTAMVVAPDGRIFVTEKPYDVRIVENGQLLPTPFVSLSVERNGERGVDGIALDPNFATNGFVYVYYTHSTPTGSFDRLSRFTASTANPDVADPTSERVLIDGIPTQTPGYHNGGVLQFGADGMLYLGIGDTIDTSLPQDLTKLQGKILRIDPAAYPNIIPSDNPFVGIAGDRGEIWASGFRNPFTGAMLPGTSQLFVNDVGSDFWEEVDQVVKGGNFGWPLAEGVSTNAAFVNPIYTYAHNGQGAAIAGGAFYTGTQFPASYSGQYFIADYVRGFIRTVDVQSGTAADFATDVNIPVDIAMAPDGGLYWLSLGPGSGTNGGIYKISFSSGNHQPTAVASAAPTNGLAPLTVSFTGAGSSDPDGDALTYNWDFGDGQTAVGRDVTHTYSTDGKYPVVLTVNDRPDGSGLSNSSAPLLITVGNQAPIPTIIAPIVGSHYSAGDTIAFAGTATDPEDGVLPASAFNWSIVFHHNTHTHPFLDSIPGVTGGTFQIPVTGETDPDQWYRVTLTVTDFGGLSQQTFVDVLPNLSTFTLASNVPGAQVTLDGQPQVTPETITGVVGMQRVLSAPAQSINNQDYAFASWSDGGAATHAILTPAASTTYTASFQPAPAPFSALYSTTAPGTCSAGQTLSFTTTLTNTGTETWNASDPDAVHLGVYFNGTSDAIYDWPSEPIRFSLPQDVAPGASVTIPITVTAPDAPGSYVLRQRLVKEEVTWFSDFIKTDVTVSSAAPVVTAVTPTGGAVGVVTTSSVTATFSAPLDPATVTASTFVLIRQGTTTPVPAVITYDAATQTATLKPSAYLLTGATYTATLKVGPTGIKDLAGNPLAAGKSWTFTTTSTPADASQFISQSVPLKMVHGRQYTISVTLKNTGTKTWDPATYRLGSANPRDNLRWGPNRVFLTAPVAPGAQVTFRFTVRAPRTIGTYNFQWQMVEERVRWFGALTTNVRIKVT